MKFQAPDAFAGSAGYRVLPLRFRRLPWDETRVLVTSLAGDWLITGRDDLQRAVEGQIDPMEPLFAEMESRYLITADPTRSTLAPLLSQYRTRKSYIEHGPSLHIFVVSLRCHHTCAYCQGFYPVNADTSKKTDHGQKGVSCPSEESSATSSSVRPLA